MIEIPPLSDEIRASLPSEAQLYIVALEQTQAELQGRIVVLEAAVADLQAHSRQTSRNSSRPPSSDPPSVPPRPARKASGRKQGAPAGHPRHERPWLAADEVDAVVEHYPEVCPHCQAPLPAALPDLAEPERQQVWEIPPVKPQVTEHHYHQVECPAGHPGQRTCRPGCLAPAYLGINTHGAGTA